MRADYVVSALDDQRLRTGGKYLSVTGVDAKSFDRLIVPNMVSGSTTALRRGEILVDRDHVVNDGWSVGSTVPVTCPDGSSGRLTVGGVCRNSEVLGSVRTKQACSERSDCTAAR
ncbi:hypothetical protein ACIRQQ_34075 [Streptomyces fuscichromogenes]|uniref:hypothetical protein n=1 Tax=Streptomyces fuscichromogenes TaxID=1324013 RepID=UPI0037FDF761